MNPVQLPKVGRNSPLLRHLDIRTSRSTNKIQFLELEKLKEGLAQQRPRLLPPLQKRDKRVEHAALHKIPNKSLLTERRLNGVKKPAFSENIHRILKLYCDKRAYVEPPKSRAHGSGVRNNCTPLRKYEHSDSRKSFLGRNIYHNMASSTSLNHNLSQNGIPPPQLKEGSRPKPQLILVNETIRVDITPKPNNPSDRLAPLLRLRSQEEAKQIAHPRLPIISFLESDQTEDGRSDNSTVIGESNNGERPIVYDAEHLSTDEDIS